MYKDDIIRL